jgi:hypothetical protein
MRSPYRKISDGTPKKTRKDLSLIGPDGSENGIKDAEK